MGKNEHARAQARDLPFGRNHRGDRTGSRKIWREVTRGPRKKGGNQRGLVLFKDKNFFRSKLGAVPTRLQVDERDMERSSDSDVKGQGHCS